MQRFACMVLSVVAASFIASSALADVVVKQNGDTIEVRVDQRHLTTLHYGGRWLKPFLQPLYSPSGVRLSRGYPFETVEGESNDHIHHRGLWYGHGLVNGVDFWTEPEHGRNRPIKYGRTVLKPPAKLVSGKESGQIVIDCDLIPLEGSRLGSERQTFTFSRAGEAYAIDVEVTISADAGVALVLGDTEEGTLGLRLADEFRQDRGATLLNADGLTTTEKIWGKRATWVDYSTTKDGQPVGVAIFDHPSNPKHPTYWHARGYGLLAANALGEHNFHRDPKRDGSLTIAAGDRLTFRYRVVLHEGDAKAADVAKLYDEYAEPSAQ